MFVCMFVEACCYALRYVLRGLDSRRLHVGLLGYLCCAYEAIDRSGEERSMKRPNFEFLLKGDVEDGDPATCSMYSHAMRAAPSSDTQALLYSSCAHPLTHSLTQSLIHSLPHSLIHSPTNALTHSLTDQLTHSLLACLPALFVTANVLYALYAFKSNPFLVKAGHDVMKR